ncbi:MAG TPA: hypothetical protein VF103_08965, partial [Polyangiaceae bacterium]
MGFKGSFLPVVVGTVFWIGCGNSEPSGGGGPSSTGNPGIDEIVNAYCSTVRSCCGAAGFPLEPVADCEAIVSGSEGFLSVLAGRAVFREPERTQCVAAIESLSQSCLQPVDSLCSGIFDGTGAEGTPCGDAQECRTGVEGVACLHAGSTFEE